MSTTAGYTDIHEALEDLDRAAKRLEMAAELFGSNSRDYPTLQSEGSRYGMWLVMNDMVRTVEKATETIGKIQARECTADVAVCN